LRRCDGRPSPGAHLSGDKPLPARREGHAARRGRGADFPLFRTGPQSARRVEGPRIAVARARQVRRGNSYHRGDDRPQPRRADGL
jgi:hypothetical protein